MDKLLSIKMGANTTRVGKYENIFDTVRLSFYAPASKDWGHIVLQLSVCPSVCLLKLNTETLCEN